MMPKVQRGHENYAHLKDSFDHISMIQYKADEKANKHYVKPAGIDYEMKIKLNDLKEEEHLL